ncbi:MAG: hypothetical protein D6695_05860 [Planctomycetota bacterium]|nr:MAG: hypothetical protein D6695_05860 [Planctomycetota bacterium]
MELSTAQKEMIKCLYKQSSRTVDELPYTEEFDRMRLTFMSWACCDISKHEFWRALSGLRKAGMLCRKSAKCRRT